jgi:hypothetical protein
MIRRALLRMFSVVFVMVLCAGCSSAQKLRIPNNPNPVIKGEVTEDKAKLALEMKLEKQIQYLEENKDKFKNQVVSLPDEDIKYYYKYYEEFPKGAEDLDIEVTPLEAYSHTYKGEAGYRKIRYQTRYTKSASRASRDDDFIRDEGMQKDTYEFDGTKWELKSAVFEVRNTSVYSENSWHATRGRIRRVEEDKPELFVDKVRSLFGLLD